MAAETVLSSFPKWIQHGVTALQMAAIQAVLAEQRGGFSVYDYTNQSHDLVAIGREGSVCCPSIDTRRHPMDWGDLNTPRIYTEITSDGSRRTGCRFIGPYLLPDELMPDWPQCSDENRRVRMLNWLLEIRPAFLGRQPRFVLDEGDEAIEDLRKDFEEYAANSF
jgi:hypothetical protein